MAVRAAWKGFLKLGAVACAIKLVGASTESESIRFRTLSRKTQRPVKAAYVDEATGKPVEAEAQVKGYALGKNDLIRIEPDEIKALKPAAEKTVEIESFVAQSDIDPVYCDKRYWVAPADRMSEEAFAVIREALARRKAAARSSIVLYQRGREVVIEPYARGMMMTTLRPRRTVVAPKSVFDGLSRVKVDAEMADIAAMIIDRKKGEFDPTAFVDSYEQALVELIDAKRHGRRPPKAAPKPEKNVVKLSEMLRKSLEKEGGKLPARKTGSRKAA